MPIRHWLLQLLGPHKSPALQLTDAAHLRMSVEMSEIVAFEPVATILWLSEVLPSGAHGNSRWKVAFYDSVTRPSGRVVKIRGIPFVFVQPDSSRLSGATLDYRGGQFTVEGAK